MRIYFEDRNNQVVRGRHGALWSAVVGLLFVAGYFLQ